MPRVTILSHAPPDRAYSVTETLAPAGAVLPPHVATREDLHLHVLTGRVAVVLDGRTRELRAGDHLAIGRNVPRALRVLESARLVWFASPGGIERVAILANDPATDPDDAAALCAAAGVTKLPKSLWDCREISPPPGPPPAANGP